MSSKLLSVLAISQITFFFFCAFSTFRTIFKLTYDTNKLHKEQGNWHGKPETNTKGLYYIL